MTNGLDLDTLDVMLDALGDFVAAELPEESLLRLDRDGRCPEEAIRRMCGDDLGVQLAFVPEDYDGMGGGAFDSYRICERLAPPRPGAGHIGVRDLPRQRPDRLRRYG